MIDPSIKPQLDGLVGATFVITGCTLSINITFGADTIQVPSAFLTRIWYVPPARPVNVFDNCQLTPPLIEYSNTLADAVFASMKIVPSDRPQSVGLEKAISLMTGAIFSSSVNS